MRTLINTFNRYVRQHPLYMYAIVAVGFIAGFTDMALGWRNWERQEPYDLVTTAYVVGPPILGLAVVVFMTLVSISFGRRQRAKRRGLPDPGDMTVRQALDVVLDKLMPSRRRLRLKFGTFKHD